MPISRDFKDELISRVDIGELAADYTTLKRQGGRMVGLCPFHSERTPSFGVSPDKGLFHCFGCGKGGDVITFVMEAENLTFIDAVRWLANRAGLTVPEDNENEGQAQNRRRTIDLLREAARLFHAQLKASTAARSYLEHRRIQWNTAVRFGLGYAPESWDLLINALTSRGYQQRELIDAGLAVDNRKGGAYDKFRNRLMFPVIDQKGQVCGFGGRIMGEGEPKYLNSPEIPNIFSKRRVLYGINLAKNTKRENYILVEGNVDVITLHQAGFDNAVASMGTSLTEEQVRLLTQNGNKAMEIVICYDADGAGIKATDRAIEEINKCNASVRVVQIPDGKDVDEFIKAHGAQAFENVLSERADDISYRLGKLSVGVDLEKPEERNDYLRKAVDLLANYDAVSRAIYAPEAAKLARVDSEFVMRESERAATNKRRSVKRGLERENERPLETVRVQARQGGLRYASPKSAVAEEGILRILLSDPKLLNDLEIMPEEFTAPELAKILVVLTERFSLGLSVEPAKVTSELNAPEAAVVARICEKAENAASSAEILNDYIQTVRREKIVASGDLNALIQLKRDG